MWVRGLKLTLLLIVFGVGLSHPMWVRGLKPPTSSASALLGMVAPHVGAWIETLVMLGVVANCIVAPHVGAWIETKRNRLAVEEVLRRILCGCVD